MAIQADARDFKESNPLELSCLPSKACGEKMSDFRELCTVTHQDLPRERDWGSPILEYDYHD